MAVFLEKFKEYFTRPPLPSVAFQLSASYLGGISVSRKERRVKHWFVFPLEKPVITPSFNNKNVQNASYLVEKIIEGMKELHVSGGKVACLIPETCLKVYVFNFSSFPSSSKEKEKIVRWQIKKQMPLLPDDARLSFDVVRTERGIKVMSCVARSSVIQEYEESFSKAGLNVNTVGIATFSLFNKLKEKKEAENSMVINLEEDHISLMAVLDSEIVLYRIKPFVLKETSRVSFPRKIDNVVTEVENTVNFVEDREKKKIDSYWIRLGTRSPEEGLVSALRERLSLPLQGVETLMPKELDFYEKRMLSPLIGQILS